MAAVRKVGIPSGMPALANGKKRGSRLEDEEESRGEVTRGWRNSKSQKERVKEIRDKGARRSARGKQGLNLAVRTAGPVGGMRERAKREA